MLVLSLMHGPIVGTNSPERDIVVDRAIGEYKRAVISRIVNGDVVANIAEASRVLAAAAVEAVDVGREGGEEVQEPDDSGEEFGDEMHRDCSF